MKTIKQLLAITTLGLLTFTASAQSWITNGLVAYYPFNGDANDASGNGHDGTVNNAALSTDRFGNTNSSFSFNGVNSFITVSNSSSLSPTGSFTVAIWLKQNSISYPQVVISKCFAGDNSSGWFVAIEPPYNAFPIGFQFSAAPSWDTPNRLISPPSLGQWYQVIYTYFSSNGLCSAYLNGSLTGTQNMSISALVSPRNLTIGAQEYPGQNNYYFFNGQMDDVRIYNRALTTTEATQLYTIESTPVVGLAYAVKPTFSNLAIGTNYQLQVSGDLNTWTNQGSAFTATTNSMVYPQYFDVANWNQLFFRLQVP